MLRKCDLKRFHFLAYAAHRTSRPDQCHIWTGDSLLRQLSAIKVTLSLPLPGEKLCS